MASINKLSIRGIRSFSPEDDEQVIEFLFPVTIIVGANGCGKTTIIESLKYAVTGSLPPGKNAGQSFVHDPKSSGQSIVKASIKLRVTNTAGHSMVVIRSMELAQQKIKLQFKALDGVIRTTDQATGKRISMSHKCTELDKQLPIFLGVSKPILEHVVFCHQEESSWPLWDSAELKKRFDAIFDSTKYTKALKNIEEIRKDYREKAKELKVECAGLASHKHAAKQYSLELEEQSNGLEDLEESIAEITKSVKHYQEVLQQNQQIMNKAQDIQTDLDTKRTELDRQRAVYQAQCSYVSEDMTQTHSLRQLKDMLRDFDDTVEQRMEERDALEGRKKKLQEDLQDIQNQVATVLSQQGRVAAEQQRYSNLLNQRLEQMQQVAHNHGVELAVTQASQKTSSQRGISQFSSQGTEGDDDELLQISKSDMEAFFQALQDKEESLRNELKQHKERSQAEQDSIQEALADLDARSRVLQQNKDKIHEEIREAQKEIQSLKSHAATGRVRQSDIEEAKRSAAHHAKERDAAANDTRKTEIPIEIRTFEEKIDKLKRRIEDDQAALSELRLTADSHNEVMVLREQVTQEFEGLRESIEDHRVDLTNNEIEEPTLPVDDVRGDEVVRILELVDTSIKEKYDDVVEKLGKLMDKVTTANHTLAEKRALLNHNNESIGSMRARLDNLLGDDGSVATYERIVKAVRQFANSNGIAVEFNDKEPQSVVNFLTARLEEVDDFDGDGGKIDAAVKVIKRLGRLVRVNQDDGELSAMVCPCCKRMLEKDDVSVYAESIKMLADPEKSPLIKVDPVKLAQDKAAKKNYDRWRKTVTQKMHDVAEANRLENETKQLSKSVNDLEIEITDLSSSLANIDSEKEAVQKEECELKKLLDASKRWSETARAIESKKSRISQKNEDLTLSMTASTIDTRDVRTVERELDEKREEKDLYMSKIARLNNELNALNTRITNFTASATRMEQRVKELETKFSKEQKDVIRKNELNEKIRQLQDEDKKLGDQLAELRPKQRTKESEKQRQREHASEEEERLSGNISSFTGEVTALKNLQNEIEKSKEALDESNMDTIDDKLKKLEEKKKEKEGSINELQPEIERVIRKINDQESQKKVIQGNIDLYHARQNLQELEKEVKGLQEELKQIEGYDKAIKEWEVAHSKKIELDEEKLRLEGRREGFREQMMLIKRKLKTPEYNNIDERHRQAMIKHDTTNIAVSDLEKYYSALDKALLRYHGIKIAEINKIIRELWTLTYKGQDIANIEIVSGQESESRAAKSYNYRVVMTKAGTQLDMRGRCSAGQRVLASIVIRLALAETFCVSFGCIALDEPTVNLDYNNKKGLAIALAQIIASRAQQSNFQLVIITHDEEFVSMIKTELSGQTGFSMPEKYFQVRREESTSGRWVSKIDAVDWDELL